MKQHFHIFSVFPVDEPFISGGGALIFNAPLSLPLLEQNTSLYVSQRCFHQKAFMNWLQVESPLAVRDWRKNSTLFIESMVFSSFLQALL